MSFFSCCTILDSLLYEFLKTAFQCKTLGNMDVQHWTYLAVNMIKGCCETVARFFCCPSIIFRVLLPRNGGCNLSSNPAVFRIPCLFFCLNCPLNCCVIRCFTSLSNFFPKLFGLSQVLSNFSQTLAFPSSTQTTLSFSFEQAIFFSSNGLKAKCGRARAAALAKNKRRKSPLHFEFLCLLTRCCVSAMAPIPSPAYILLFIFPPLFSFQEDDNRRHIAKLCLQRRHSF